MRKILLVILAMLVGVGAVCAQTQPKPDLGKIKTSLDVDKIEARVVIRTLLKSAKVSFIIDGDVQGTVTAYLENVSVERALMEVLRQVGAGYRYEDGIYRIVKLKEKSVAGESKEFGDLTLDFNDTDIREALRSLFKTVGMSYSIDPEVKGTVTLSLKNAPFDTAFLNILKQVDATYRIEGGVYEIIKRDAEPQRDPSENTVDIDLQNADIREALRVVFKKMNVSYTIAPEVQGTVTASLKGVTFETALTSILKQVDATYRVEGGVYQIVKR